MRYVHKLLLAIVLASVTSVNCDAWQVPSAHIGVKAYFEITLGTHSSGQQETSRYQIGFANSNSDLNRVQGLLDANAVVVHVGGTFRNACGTPIFSAQPGFTTGHVLGIAVDTTHSGNGFDVLDRTATPGAWTPNPAMFSLSCVLPGNLYIVFGAPAWPQCGNLEGTDSATLNTGASAFTGSVPSGYATWDTVVGSATTWGSSGSIARTATTGGSGTTTLEAALSAGNLTATISTDGSNNANNWFQNAWPANTYLAGGTTVDCGGFFASIYYNPSAMTGGELNGPIFNNSWTSATIGVRSTTAIAHAP